MPWNGAVRKKETLHSTVLWIRELAYLLQRTVRGRENLKDGIQHAQPDWIRYVGAGAFLAAWTWNSLLSALLPDAMPVDKKWFGEPF
jgi:hypothetical protein